MCGVLWYVLRKTAFDGCFSTQQNIERWIVLGDDNKASRSWLPGFFKLPFEVHVPFGVEHPALERDFLSEPRLLIRLYLKI